MAESYFGPLWGTSCWVMNCMAKMVREHGRGMWGRVGEVLEFLWATEFGQ